MINRIIDAISMALNDEFNPNSKNNYNYLNLLCLHFLGG